VQDHLILAFEIHRKRSTIRVLAKTQAFRGTGSQLFYRQFHESDDAIQICTGREPNLDPGRLRGPIRVHFGVAWMYQPFTCNDDLSEPDVQLSVVMEVSKVFATVAKGRESIISTGPQAMLDAQFLESSDELRAQIGHVSYPS
jgi:hypothetical protein